MNRLLLNSTEGRAIVKLARMAIDAHFSGKRTSPAIDITPALREEKGVFVTLLEHSNGGLRGCIGLPFPTRPLFEQVKTAAIEAATADPRFDPISSEQFKKRIILEVTVLSAFEPIWMKNPLDLRENIVVGRDGVMIDGAGGHGLLLPQVAVDEGFDSEEFLSHCCMKADLPPDAWLTSNVRVSRFQGQVFTEESPDGTVFERRLNRTT